MYVTQKNIETMVELHAFVHGALENADDQEYWGELSNQTRIIIDKMKAQQSRQDFSAMVKKEKRKILKKQ